MANIWTEASQAYLRAQDRHDARRREQEAKAERERQRQLEEQQRAKAEERSKIEMAAVLAGMREQGIVPEGEATDYALPMFDGLAGGLPASGASMTMPKDTRYKPLGQSGFTLDTQNSRPAQQRVAQHEQERRSRAVAEAQQRQRDKEAEAAQRRAEAMERLRHGNDMREIGARTAGDLRVASQRATLAAEKPEKAEKPGNPTDGERKAAMYYERAVPSLEKVNEFGTPAMMDILKQKGGVLGKWQTSKEGKQYMQAAMSWVINVLRQDSQGTITEQEMEFYFDTYLPRPNDDPQTLAQKAAARQKATEGLLIVAGRAAPKQGASPFGGDSRAANVQAQGTNWSAFIDKYDLEPPKRP